MKNLVYPKMLLIFLTLSFDLKIKTNEGLNDFLINGPIEQLYTKLIH